MRTCETASLKRYLSFENLVVFPLPSFALRWVRKDRGGLLGFPGEWCFADDVVNVVFGAKAESALVTDF